MKVTFSHFTVDDYCRGMQRKEILVNRDYQRSSKVWPPQARSFFIETILLDYPIPKFSLYQITDPKSKRTYKEIVDGQQRSLTIYDFFNNELRISATSEIPEVAGRFFSQLEEETQTQFLEYALPVDIFVHTTPDEIREVFRRINSYNVPLNPEECRHALFQGVFKWFIYRLSKQYSQSLINLGVFKESQLVRMADAKLFSEICHALLFGITTTNKTKLDILYKSNDIEFPEVDEIELRIKNIANALFSIEDIHNGPLMKPFLFYSLALAITHVFQESDKLTEVYQVNRPYRFVRDIVLTNLTALADSIENPDASSRFAEFVAASVSKTNVADHRKARFSWLCKALEPRLLP